MTFSHLNRRVHLYVGLALLPWFFMYGISSVPFAHGELFQRLDAAKNLPAWTLRSERTLDVAVPTDPKEMRTFAAMLLKDAGIATAGTSYGTYRQSPSQINVYWYSFWTSTQLKYFIDRRTLTVEDRRFRWDQFLTGMHARGGFDQEGVLQDSWSVVVDLVCVAMIVWVISGLYMWWGLPALRRWGLLAIVAGGASFALFTLRL